MVVCSYSGGGASQYLTNKYGFGTMAVVGTAPMKITAQEEYGLRCILQLASVPAGEPLAGGEIARREGLSYPYVEKLLWTLKRAGLTKSQDRKSTRLNSSHQIISYAVFCLKK